MHSPPPILPARNPLRSPTGAILPPHQPLRVAEIWDPEIGNYVKRLPEGGFGGVVDDGRASRFGGVTIGSSNARRMSNGVPILRPGMEVALRDGLPAQGIGRSRSVNDHRITNDNNNNTTTSLRAPTPRLLSPTTTERPFSHPTASGPGQEFSLTVHEAISNLRQTYINSLHINEFETESRADGEVVANANGSTSSNRGHPSTASTPPPLPPLPRPTTPLHRSISNPSASSSAQQASARNFSLPSYGSPSAKEEQQQQQLALGSRSISGPLPPPSYVSPPANEEQQQPFELEAHSISRPLHAQQQQQQRFALESRSLSGPLPLPSTNSMWNLHDGSAVAMNATPTTPVQNTPHRPLRRMRSRSVNLGRIAEAREVSRMPARKLGWWDEGEDAVGKDEGTDVGKTAEGEEEGAGYDLAVEVDVGKPVKAAVTTTTKPKRKVWKEVDVVEEELVEEVQGKEEEEACGRCKSIRRALARNPLCCVDRAKVHRLCFKCWSEALAEGLKSEDREKWLCCVVCGRELLSGDTKRLASRGTILR
jgi:hypothetical protein